MCECNNLGTERDIIGLTADHQVVYFAAQADLEDSLTLSRALLKRWASVYIALHQNLYNYTDIRT